MKSKLKDTDEGLSAFQRVASDTKLGNQRQVEEELYKKSWQSAKIDDFEKKLGIPLPSNEPAKRNVLVKTKTFIMEFDKDQALLTELLNSPKYKIIYWKDTWTVDGNYRIFAIYEDNLDFKQPEKK
jgi:hypothetical protein